MVMSNVPIYVYKIEGGPISVGKRIPYRVTAVESDRIIDLETLSGMANVVDVSLKIKLRGVHAYYDQTFVLIFVCPGTDIRELPSPIDTGVCPKVNQNNLSPQISVG